MSVSRNIEKWLLDKSESVKDAVRARPPGVYVDMAMERVVELRRYAMNGSAVVGTGTILSGELAGAEIHGIAIDDLVPVKSESGRYFIYDAKASGE